MKTIEQVVEYAKQKRNDALSKSDGEGYESGKFSAFSMVLEYIFEEEDEQARKERQNETI